MSGMKIPPEMLKGLQTTVMSLLPYESSFEPKSNEVRSLIEIFDLIQTEIPEFSDLEGFMWVIAKNTEKSPERQTALGNIFTKLGAILENELE